LINKVQLLLINCENVRKGN